MNPFYRTSTFDLAEEVRTVTNLFYPKAVAQEVTEVRQFDPLHGMSACVAAPYDQHAANRAFDALVAKFVEDIEFSGIDDIEAAVAEAWLIVQEKQETRNEEMARGR